MSYVPVSVSASSAELQHNVPLDLIESFLLYVLPLLDTRDKFVSTDLALDIKSKWLQMFSFANEFSNLINDWEGKGGPPPKVFKIPNSTKNKVQSLLDSGEFTNLRGLLYYIKGRLDSMKEK